MRDAVIPGLVPGIQLSAGSGASGTMDPGDKHRDDNGYRWRSSHSHYAFATPQKNGIGPLTTPLTLLRQA